jgi:aminobenzoyl-glutamate utilization protein B
MSLDTRSTANEITDWLDEREQRFLTISDEIWAHPELGLAEHFACQLQVDDLERDGFTITRNVGDMPTAFMAEWSQGSGGPVIGFLGEYDALPGLSQKNQDVQDPLVADGPGHGCGHNLLGTAALAAASVLKGWLTHTGQAGTVRYYGCPAEETGEGKVFMARAGVFDDLDLALTWHPGSKNTVWAGSCLAVNNIRYRFKGRTAHAAANPESGRSALDAVELMNIGVNYLREHMIDEARIHYVITKGGGAPNVVPDDCEVWYFIRSPERHQVDELTERVRNVAQGAALMTETTLEEIFVAGSYNLLPNDVLSDQLMSALERLGPISFSDDEIAYAKTIINAFPIELRRVFLKQEKVPLDLIEAGLTGEIWPIADRGEVLPGSTDVSDVSWIAPTAQCTTPTWALGVPGHSWAVTATGAMSIGHKGMMQAAKAMAITAADAVLDPSIIERAQAEFTKRTEGRPYSCPIPDHVKPRVA